MVSGASGEAVPGTERDHVGGNAGGAEAFAIGNDGRSGFMARRRDDVVDVLVGRNIRILRKQRRMSQTDLANKIGVTFQQVQKYENGTNRVGSGRLFRISAIFNVPVATLFDGMEQASASQPDASPTALLAGPYALRLLQAFSQLEDNSLRKSIAEMVEHMPSKCEESTRQKRR